MTIPFALLLAASIHPPAASTPFRQPQLAAAHGQIAMTFGGGSSIYFASSKDGGRTFTQPVTVAEAGALALGRHRGPRLVILKHALVVSAIVGGKVATGKHAHGLPESGNLAVWRSADRGKTWTRGGVINDVPGAAREGLHAMAAGADGKLFAVWLDLRENGMRLFGAQSRNAGLTWSKNVQVYQSPSGTICQCCHPSLSIDETGRVWVMWRNVLDGSRDLHLASSSDGIHFEAPRKLGEGTWKIDACPMDGGGFVVHGSRVTAAWRREGEIFLNEPGKPERAIGPGKDVAIAAGKAGIFVAWTKDGAIQTMTPRAAEPQLLSPDGAFVNLTTLEDGTVLAAWEARGSIETKHLN